MRSTVKQQMNDGHHSERNRKIARIWCLARDLKLDSKMLHVMVTAITGSESISVLSQGLLMKVIHAMEKEKSRVKRHNAYERKKKSQSGNVTFLPTTEQRTKVQSIIDDIDHQIRIRDRESYLEAICRRTFHKNYSRLNNHEMQGLIEALKSILHRFQNKRRDTL